LALAWFIPVPALAAPVDSSALAHEHFENGIEAVQRGELSTAAREFEAAQALSPNAVVLYNLGQMYTALGLHVEAERALQQYLTSESRPADQARLEAVEALLEFNRSRIGTVMLELVPADAQLEVDGSPATLPSTMRLRLTGGQRHVIVATRAGFMASISNVDVAPGEEVRLRIELTPSPKPPAASPPPNARPAAAEPARDLSPPAPPAKTELSTAGVVALSTAAAGGAALVTSFVLGLHANHLMDESNANGHCDAQGCDARGLELRHSAVKHDHWATGLFVSGAVAVTAGVTLYLRRGKQPAASSVVKLTISPLIDPWHGGAARFTLDF
jgi:hypothetical protein